MSCEYRRRHERSEIPDHALGRGVGGGPARRRLDSVALPRVVPIGEPKAPLSRSCGGV